MLFGHLQGLLLLGATLPLNICPGAALRRILARQAHRKPREQPLGTTQRGPSRRSMEGHAMARANLAARPRLRAQPAPPTLADPTAATPGVPSPWRARRPEAERGAGAAAAGLPLPALLLLLALATGAAAQGGYHVAGQVGLAALLAGALLASVLALAQSRDRHWPALLAAPVPAAGALATWAVLSGARAGDARGSLPIVGLLGGISVVIVVCRRLSRAERELLVWGTVAVGALVATTGWIGVAFRRPPWALESSGVWRAATTLTYANAAAGLLVPLALVALAGLCGASRVRSASGSSSSARRTPLPLLAAAACLVTLGAAATLSRFGLLTLSLGGVALTLLLGPRRFLRRAAAPALGAAVAFVSLLPSVPGDHPARPALACVGLAAGLLIAVAGPSALGGLLRALGRPRAAVALIALGVAATGTLALLGPTLHAISAVRLTLASPARTQSTQAALRLAATHPLTGVGPGNAGLSWTGPGGARLFSRYAHDEYLQILVELGAIGAGLLGVLLVGAGAQVARGRRFAPSPAVWAGAVAGLAAFGLHSGADFLWHIPVIPLTAALLIGITAAPTTAPGGSGSPSTKEV